MKAIFLAFRENFKNIYRSSRIEFLGQKDLMEVINYYCNTNTYTKEDTPNVVYTDGDVVICENSETQKTGSFEFGDLKYYVFDMEELNYEDTDDKFITALVNYVADNFRDVDSEVVDYIVSHFPGHVGEKANFVKYVKHLFQREDIEELDIEEMLDKYHGGKYNNYTIDVIYKGDDYEEPSELDEYFFGFKEYDKCTGYKNRIEFLGEMIIDDIYLRYCEEKQWSREGAKIYDCDKNIISEDGNMAMGLIVDGAITYRVIKLKDLVNYEKQAKLVYDYYKEVNAVIANFLNEHFFFDEE